MPWMSRRCLIMLALPFDSYEKWAIVLRFLLTQTRQTQRSFLLLLVNLMRNPLTHHQASLALFNLGGVAARSWPLNSSNGKVAISLGVGFSSRLRILPGGVCGQPRDGMEHRVEGPDGHGDEGSMSDDSEPSWADTKIGELWSIAMRDE